MLDNSTPRHHRREEDKQVDMIFKVRNILNLLFMVGACAGMYFYFFQNRQIGTFIILSSITLKVAECVLRFFHK